MVRTQPPLEHGFVGVDAQEDPHTWIRVLDTLDREPFYVAYKRRYSRWSHQNLMVDISTSAEELVEEPGRLSL
jgi:hypothetical protein